MPDGIDIIGFEFFPHGKDYCTAEKENHALTDDKDVVGYAIFPEVPWLELIKKDI